MLLSHANLCPILPVVIPSLSPIKIMPYTNKINQEEEPKTWQNLQAKLLALYTEEIAKDEINMQKCVEIGNQIIKTGALLDEAQKTIQQVTT